jgi:hypothetical protein
MTTDLLIQLMSLLLYVATIFWGLLAFIDINKSHHQVSVKYIGSAVVFLSMFTAIVFIYAQLMWVKNEQWASLSIAETAVWLLYDWMNGLSHLAIVLLIRAFMRWEQLSPCQAAGGTCISTHVAASELEQDRRLAEVAEAIKYLNKRVERLGEL